METILSKIKVADLPQLCWKGGSKLALLEQWAHSMGMEIGGLHYLLEIFWTRAVKVVKDAHFAYSTCHEGRCRDTRYDLCSSTPSFLT